MIHNLDRESVAASSCALAGFRKDRLRIPPQGGCATAGPVLYDGAMGYTTVIEAEPGSGGWAVILRAVLTRAESNELFLSGDSMVSWPVDGLESTDDLRLERSSMFVSEIAARPAGLRIRYRERSQAEQAAAVLRLQLGQIGIEEET